MKLYSMKPMDSIGTVVVFGWATTKKTAPDRRVRTFPMRGYVTTYDEQTFGSTTFAWKRVKIKAPPRPQGTARAKRAPIEPSADKERAAKRTARESSTMSVRYRGGAEAWWEITYYGKVKRFSGVLSFHDVMRFVLELPDL